MRYEYNLLAIFTSFAVKPSNVDVTPQNSHEAIVSFYNPDRILYHPSNAQFELSKNTILLETEDSRKIVLHEADATFGPNILHVPVVLPPQVEPIKVNLIVEAEYRDGTVMCSRPYPLEKLPCYGKQSSCTIQY